MQVTDDSLKKKNPTVLQNVSIRCCTKLSPASAADLANSPAFGNSSVMWKG